MSSRSLNTVMLIGNLTRDPELRYTPTGAAVCTIGLATNRSWTTESGDKKEETEFHRVVAWNKLAELCSQLLTKGRKIYVEGRLRTNSWQTADGGQRSTTEIVIEDMILLDSRKVSPVVSEESAEPVSVQPTVSSVPVIPKKAPVNPPPADDTAKSGNQTGVPSEDVNPDDIPF